MARILVVEDEPTISMVLAESLTDEGHTVTALRNGTLGLEAVLHGGPFDLVLLDLLLPGLGGAEILRAIRATPKLQATPVLLITGLSMGVKQFPPYGSYQGRIRKPFELAELISSINVLLGNSLAVEAKVN